MLQIMAFASLVRIQRFIPSSKIPSYLIRRGLVVVSSRIGSANCSPVGKRWTIAEFRRVDGLSLPKPAPNRGFVSPRSTRKAGASCSNIEFTMKRLREPIEG